MLPTQCSQGCQTCILTALLTQPCADNLRLPPMCRPWNGEAPTHFNMGTPEPRCCCGCCSFSPQSSSRCSTGVLEAGLEEKECSRVLWRTADSLEVLVVMTRLRGLQPVEPCPVDPCLRNEYRGVCGGSLAQGLGIRLFAFGGACWPLAFGLCTSRPSVGPNVFWSCQRSPWMTCPVWLLRGSAVPENGTGGGDFVPGLFRRGKSWEGKTSPPLESPSSKWKAGGQWIAGLPGFHSSGFMYHRKKRVAQGHQKAWCTTLPTPLVLYETA